ncbi:hypothetical protein FBR01_00975 [Anaerolineae bacterium CFX8]|nr:hypothetical protein [Anaerolineae bacterium CFX8]
MSDAAATLLIAVMLLFVAAILGLIALASILRQRRNYMADRARAALQPALIPAAAPPPMPRPAPKLSSRVSMPLPDYQRLPQQNGSPDQVVMVIEPVEGPTRDQVNVQKLIDFLKQETVKSNASPKVS